MEEQPKDSKPTHHNPLHSSPPPPLLLLLSSIIIIGVSWTCFVFFLLLTTSAMSFWILTPNPSESIGFKGAEEEEGEEPTLADLAPKHKRYSLEEGKESYASTTSGHGGGGSSGGDAPSMVRIASLRGGAPLSYALDGLHYHSSSVKGSG